MSVYDNLLTRIGVSVQANGRGQKTVAIGGNCSFGDTPSFMSATFYCTPDEAMELARQLRIAATHVVPSGRCIRIEEAQEVAA